MESESKNEINTNEIKEEKITFNNLPMLCLVEIAGFIDNDKNCLVYRNISRKFNEAIQLKLYMKTKDGDGEFYKKCFLVLNTKCHKYFNENIYPFLINPDDVYDFLSLKNEIKFNKLFNYSFNELKKIITTNKLKIKLENLEKTFKKSIIRFIVTMIIKNFEIDDYDSLDFNKLNPYNDAKDMIILLIRLMKKLKYLNLSEIIINDENFLGKILDKIESRDEFTLVLEGVYMSNNLVKKIKMINDTNMGIKIIIDKKYNGQINYLGGKKMNKHKNINKKKFKNLEFIK